jgi:hypothetical protein
LPPQGNEIGLGKFASPQSSAALAVNTFGWFLERPMDLPPLPGTEAMGTPERVEVEYCARFPFRGGRHPWLDAVVITPTHLIGVESKRFEPFRDTQTVSLSSAFDRPVWGPQMGHYATMRDALRSGEVRFHHLDAAQLVKHAFGLVTARPGGCPGGLYCFISTPSLRNEVSARLPPRTTAVTETKSPPLLGSWTAMK